MLLSFSFGTFLTYYDVTNRKLKYVLTSSIVQKLTKWERNTPMETKNNLWGVFFEDIKLVLLSDPIVIVLTNKKVFLIEIQFFWLKLQVRSFSWLLSINHNQANITSN